MMGNTDAATTTHSDYQDRTTDQESVGAHRQRPEVTIVIPTRNEAGNVVELVDRLDAALGGTPAEFLFVDDSDDRTPDVIRKTARGSNREIRLLHRESGHREGGLGGAVLAGFQVARAPLAVVIDGDLQHPPEDVPSLLAALRREGTDLAYGTRYAGGGHAGGLDGVVRQAVSRSSTWVAKALFPRRLRGVSDPMSGFFAVRIAALDLSELRPNGYKVLLEILAGSRLRNMAGVPFTFRERHSGESKASLTEGLRFGLQLLALRLGLTGSRLRQIISFAAVGASGVAVSTLAMWILLSATSLNYLAASVVSTNAAILSNFLLIQAFVFRSGADGSFSRFIRFWLLNLALLPVQLGLLSLLVEAADVGALVANVIVLLAVFVLRYTFSATMIFRRRGSDAPSVQARRRPAHRQAGNSTSYFARIVPVVVVALVAYPAVALHAWWVIEEGGWSDIAFITLVVSALTIVIVRAAPAPTEPDVHDRQLDIILAVPFIGGSIWLAVGWPDAPFLALSLSAREVWGFEIFLIGAALVLLGTRMTIRLRWALALPLLALPWVTEHPAVFIVAVLAATLGTAAVAFWHRRAHAASPGNPVLVRGHRLPSYRLAGCVVLVVAALLAVITLIPAGDATSQPDIADSGSLTGALLEG